MSAHTKIFFQHIPKTGGSAFNQVFRPVVPPDRYFEHIESRPGLLQSVPQDGLPFFLSGHVHFELVRDLLERPDVFTITILREPVAQLISHLKWVKYVGSPKYPDPTAIDVEILEFARELFRVPLSDIASVGDLLDHPLGLRLFDNLQVRYLSDPFVLRVGPEHAKRAIENIRKFKFIFALEDMATALERLSRKFPGIANINLYNAAQIADEVDLRNAEISNFYLERTVLDRNLYLSSRSFSLRCHLLEAAGAIPR